MNHCKTCQFWVKCRAPRPGELNVRWQIGGTCTKDKLTEEYGDESYVEDALVYSYQEDGHFWTGPEFGCVHHEEIQK